MCERRREDLGPERRTTLFSVIESNTELVRLIKNAALRRTMRHKQKLVYGKLKHLDAFGCDGEALQAGQTKSPLARFSVIGIRYTVTVEKSSASLARLIFEGAERAATDSQTLRFFVFFHQAASFDTCLSLCASLQAFFYP